MAPILIAQSVRRARFTAVVARVHEAALFPAHENVLLVELAELRSREEQAGEGIGCGGGGGCCGCGVRLGEGVEGGEGEPVLGVEVGGCGGEGDGVCEGWVGGAAFCGGGCWGEEGVGAVVEDVAFEVGCYWGVFLASFGARGCGGRGCGCGCGCGARVEDVDC